MTNFITVTDVYDVEMFLNLDNVVALTKAGPNRTKVTPSGGQGFEVKGEPRFIAHLKPLEG